MVGRAGVGWGREGREVGVRLGREGRGEEGWEGEGGWHGVWREPEVSLIEVSVVSNRGREGGAGRGTGGQELSFVRQDSEVDWTCPVVPRVAC